MKNTSPSQVYGPAINRITDVMAHIDRFAFKGVTRLAEGAGVSPSSVSRLVHGKINPSFVLVARITSAIEKQLGYRIDPRDLVAECGEFLTDYVCDVCNGSCGGCLPDNARDEFGDMKPAFADVQAGRWVASRYPHGFKGRKEVK